MIRYFLAALAALVAAPAAASVPATCETLDVVLASLPATEREVELKGICPKIKVRNVFDRRVTIDASGATLTGLELLGKNITWRGGVITALKGFSGIARDGYAVYIQGENITLSGAFITEARNGLVLAKSRNIGLYSNLVWRIRNDGFNISETTNLAVSYNRFLEPHPIEPTCDGKTWELAQRDCPGVWKDGDHAGGVQLRNAVINGRFTFNVIEGDWDGGISHNDWAGHDAPLNGILIADNYVRGPMYTAFQAQRDNCLNCRIERNTVRRTRPERRTSIFYGMATHCGNDIEGFEPDTPCP